MPVALKKGSVILAIQDDGSKLVSCKCCKSLCDLDLNSSGGDDGYLETFSVNTGSVGFDVSVTFTAFFQADRFLIQGIYDTGCIGEQAGQPQSVTQTVTIPPNTENITLRVIPNCLGGSGTVWSLSIICLEETPAP